MNIYLGRRHQAMKKDKSGQIMKCMSWCGATTALVHVDLVDVLMMDLARYIKQPHTHTWIVCAVACKKRFIKVAKKRLKTNWATEGGRQNKNCKNTGQAGPQRSQCQAAAGLWPRMTPRESQKTAYSCSIMKGTPVSTPITARTWSKDNYETHRETFARHLKTASYSYTIHNKPNWNPKWQWQHQQQQQQ